MSQPHWNSARLALGTYDSLGESNQLQHCSVAAFSRSTTGGIFSAACFVLASVLFILFSPLASATDLGNKLTRKVTSSLVRIEVDFIDSEGRIVSTGQGHAVRVDPNGIYLTATHVVLPSRSALENNPFITAFTIRLLKVAGESKYQGWSTFRVVSSSALASVLRLSPSVGLHDCRKAPWQGYLPCLQEELSTSEDYAFLVLNESLRYDDSSYVNLLGPWEPANTLVERWKEDSLSMRVVSSFSTQGGPEVEVVHPVAGYLQKAEARLEATVKNTFVGGVSGSPLLIFRERAEEDPEVFLVGIVVKNVRNPTADNASQDYREVDVCLAGVHGFGRHLLKLLDQELVSTDCSRCPPTLSAIACVASKHEKLQTVERCISSFGLLRGTYAVLGMLESGLVPYLNQASQSQESVAEILRIALRDLAEQAPLPGDLQERSRRITAALLARSAASIKEADKAAEELSPLASSQSALQRKLSDIQQIRGNLEVEQSRYYYAGSGIAGSGRIIHNQGMYQRLEGQIEEQRRRESEVWNNLRSLGEQRSRIDSVIAAARQASSVHEALSNATLEMASLLAGSRFDSRAVMDALEGLIISGHLASEAKNAAEVLLSAISGSRSLAR